MNCFLTGANGFIGSRLAEHLSGQGHAVRCLVRSPGKFASLVKLSGVTQVTGDLDNSGALEEGVKGCDTVFHLAAYTKPWSKDKTISYRINVIGTENLLKASLNAGVKRFVFTSSAAVLGPSPGVEPIGEDFPRTVPLFNEYEETKTAAEEIVKSYSRDSMETVIVNPPRVYGPGPITESNGMTRIIRGYLKGTWRIIPGDGSCIGSYVYVEDVVRGHILAAKLGKAGERYALGGENITFDELFRVLGEVTGKPRHMVHFPVKIMIAISGMLEWQAELTGIPPLITAAWVKKYMNHWSVSSQKAIHELGYTITPFREGAAATVRWIEQAEKQNI